MKNQPRSKKQIKSAESLAKILRNLADKVERGIVINTNIRMSVDYEKIAVGRAIENYTNGHEDFNMELSLYDPEKDQRDQIGE